MRAELERRGVPAESIHTTSWGDLMALRTRWRTLDSARTVFFVILDGQRFPVRPREYEPPCANVAGVVQIPCAAIDLSSDPTVSGAVYSWGSNDLSRLGRSSRSTVAPPLLDGSAPQTPRTPRRRAAGRRAHTEPSPPFARAGCRRAAVTR